jgi:hypothetical protein
MSKFILLLAAVFAILFISACSGMGCDEADGCQTQTYNGYCVDTDRDYSICIPSTEEECLLLTKGYGFSEWLYFYRTCPSGYDDAPKACYFSNWGCELMEPPYSETDCRNEHGSFMDFGTCLRTYGIWKVSYPGNTTYGSCTWPGYACEENLPRYECDEADGEIFVSNGTCSTASFPYCAYYYGDCDLIGGSYTNSKSECFYGDGFLASLKFCQEYGFVIEGMDY